MSDSLTPDTSSVTSQPALPERPKPHSTLQTQASEAIAYLRPLVSSSQLNPDLRLTLQSIQNTIQNLRDTIIAMDAAAEENHERMVAIIQSQRHH